MLSLKVFWLQDSESKNQSSLKLIFTNSQQIPQIAKYTSPLCHTVPVVQNVWSAFSIPRNNIHIGYINM